MKTILPILLLTAALLPAQDLKYDNTGLGQVVQSASFEFANFKMYENENEWKGKTVSVSGLYYPNRIYSRTKSVLIHISGTGAFGPVSTAVYLDSPLPTIVSYGQETPAMTPGMSVRVVGTLKRTEPFITWEGYQMMLPAMDGIAIYRQDDANLQYPIWVSRAYKR